jgi:hypothetical protein
MNIFNGTFVNLLTSTLSANNIKITGPQGSATIGTDSNSIIYTQGGFTTPFIKNKEYIKVSNKHREPKIYKD